MDATRIMKRERVIHAIVSDSENIYGMTAICFPDTVHIRLMIA